MSKLSISLAALAFAAITFVPVFGQDSKPAKLTAEQVISKHLESIGTPQARAAAKSKVLVGNGIVTAKGGYVGRLSGPAQMATEGDKMLFAVVFEANNYPYEKIGYDGKDLTFGRHVGGPSSLSDFLRANKVIFKRGLFGGVFASNWPLLEIKKGIELDYEGETGAEGQRIHKVKLFTPDIGSLSVFMYFDSDFRHVRTEYKQVKSGLMTKSPSSAGVEPMFRKGAELDYYTLTENFSNFAKVGDLTLPLGYVVDVASKTSQESMTWSLIFTDVYYNEAFDAAVFRVS